MTCIIQRINSSIPLQPNYKRTKNTSQLDTMSLSSSPSTSSQLPKTETNKSITQKKPIRTKKTHTSTSPGTTKRLMCEENPTFCNLAGRVLLFQGEVLLYSVHWALEQLDNAMLSVCCYSVLAPTPGFEQGASS